MSRMFERMERKQLALGTMMLTPGPELVEVAGYSGLDFVCLDMMVTSLDWRDAAHAILAANRYHVTPWLRLPAYPWGALDCPADLSALVLRGLSLGAECVLASVNTGDEVERLLHPLSNPHRRVYILQGGEGRTDTQQRIDASEASQCVIPILESRQALERIDEILEVPGLRVLYLGLGDITKALGHPGDDRHPAVRKAIAGVVTRARSKGVAVAANALGYNAASDLSQQVFNGIESLSELGVSAVLIPRPTLVLQRFYEATLARLRTELPAVYK